MDMYSEGWYGIKRCIEYEMSGYVVRGRGRRMTVSRGVGWCMCERLTRASMEFDVKRLID